MKIIFVFSIMIPFFIYIGYVKGQQDKVLDVSQEYKERIERLKEGYNERIEVSFQHGCSTAIIAGCPKDGEPANICVENGLQFCASQIGDTL